MELFDKSMSPAFSEMPGFLGGRVIVTKRKVKHDAKLVPDGVREPAPGVVVSLRNLVMLEVNECLDGFLCR